MANKTGAKWNKGGSMARKKGFWIDYSAFEDYADRLEQLGADLQEVFGDAMDKAGETVQQDTISAIEDGNLPAHGEYSTGDTRAAVLSDVKTVWQGSVGTINLGFDKTKSGAGGFLITGTPKMSPDYALEKIYSKKGYANKIKKQIQESLQEEIDKRM